MNSINKAIAAYVAEKHADRETVQVRYNGEDYDATFKVLSFIEIDRLRTYPFGATGMDAKRMAGNNIRWLAATLYDDSGALWQPDMIETWDPKLIDLLANESRRVNRQNETTEEAAKNSETTASAGT